MKDEVSSWKIYESTMHVMFIFIGGTVDIPEKVGHIGFSKIQEGD